MLTKDYARQSLGFVRLLLGLYLHQGPLRRQPHVFRVEAMMLRGSSVLSGNPHPRSTLGQGRRKGLNKIRDKPLSAQVRECESITLI